MNQTFRAGGKTPVRGFSLLELLVSVAVGGATLAMLFYVFLLANRQTDQQVLDARVVAEGTSIARNIEDLLSRYQPPQSRAARAGESRAMVFESGRLEIYSSARTEGRADSRFVIQTRTSSGGREYIAIGQQAPGATGDPEWRPASTTHDQFASSIDFRYAERFDAELQPQLQPDYAGAGAPAYVQFRIVVRSLKNPEFRPLILHSGVALR